MILAGVIAILASISLERSDFMAYHTVEHKFDSMRGWKKPLYSGTRVYRNKREVSNRISHLCREWGYDNVFPMPDKKDPTTTVVYVRVK